MTQMAASTSKTNLTTAKKNVKLININNEKIV